MTGGIIYLDITRLIARIWRTTPTGIDRVELAYALELKRQADSRLRFVAADAFGAIREVPKALGWSLVQTLQTVWRGEADSRRRLPAIALGLTATLRRKATTPGTTGLGRPVYLLVSHKNLERPKAIQRFCRTTGAAFIPFIHDLIPIEFPEYVRAGDADKHRARIATVDRLADAAIVATRATAEALVRYLPGFARPIAVAPFGIEVPEESGPARPSTDPYFAFISTIEPRKNHLLLLQTWRALATSLGPDTPHLILLGRRGWENEQILDMLDRCDTIRAHVTECQGRTDREVQDLLQGARALLMPSFAEGFGLPLAEALALGVPAIASDIPAHREVGGTAADYLDPTDGPAWRRAITDYANLASPRRLAQVARMANWQRARWPTHIQTVLGLIDDLPANRSAGRQCPRQAAHPRTASEAAASESAPAPEATKDPVLQH